jgi:T5SS/PEP-CTERM-associated repeat protein/autotransporter-associated beta strand protein
MSFPPLPIDLRLGVDEIWDALADFGGTRVEEAQLFLMGRLKELIGADDAVWVGVVRMAHGGEAERGDHQLGWRGRAVVHLEWTDLKREVVAAAMKAQEVDGGVPSSIEMAKLAGNFRTLTLRELHEMETFVLTEHYKSCFIPFGITDRMWCVFPVNEDCEVAYIFDRCGNVPGFTEQEKRLVSEALRPLKWFHRKTMLAHGVMMGDERLTPRERSLCSQLLGSQTEKEIADSLGLALSTTRSYVQALYRKFGVQGRAGLMALWLGGGADFLTAPSFEGVFIPALKRAWLKGFRRVPSMKSSSLFLALSFLSIPVLHGQPLIETLGNVLPGTPVSPNWVINGTLSLGETSNGSVMISGGATVTNTTGYLGTRTNKYGTMTVDGAGSLWTNSLDIAVGNDGIGTLNITNGGKTVNRSGYVSINQFSQGRVNISGAGSWWENTADLYVGYADICSMNLSDGGKVTATRTYLGWNGSGIGVATVDGAGSVWQSSSEFHVGGGSGEGRLTLINGGKISVSNGAGTLNIATNSGSKGAVNIGGSNVASSTSAGVIEAAKVAFGNGTGSLNFNQNNSLTLSAAITGGSGGTVKQQGSGTTILTGANTYSGATTVSGGKLVVNGSITASNVTVQSGGTLGGSGSLFNVTTQTGATLAPGNSIGTLSANSLTWDSGATLVFELGAGSCDLLDLNGALTKGVNGEHVFNFVNAGWQVGETYTLIEFGSTNFAAGDFSFSNTGGFDGDFVLNGNNLQFQLTAIPEVSSCGLAGIALLSFAFRRRK